MCKDEKKAKQNYLIGCPDENIQKFDVIVCSDTALTTLNQYQEKPELETSLNICQDKNISQSFEEIALDDCSKLSQIQNSIIRTPKKKLKKCRFCNFKKRKCMLNYFSCKALQLSCTKCLKIGHFPQSLNCKARRKKRDYTQEKFVDQQGIKSNSNRVLVIPTDTSSFDVELLRMDISNDEVHDQNVSYCPVADLSFDQFDNFEDLKLHSIDGDASVVSDIEVTLSTTSSSNMRFGTSLIGEESFSQDNPNAKEINQLDGFEELDCNNTAREIYAIKCEEKSIVDIINFFRSQNTLWIDTQKHFLCDSNQSCFFCNMRSSCLRIRQERVNGPKCLHVNEFTR